MARDFRPTDPRYHLRKDRIAGELYIPGFPLRFSEFPQLLALEAAFLGEHNREILQNYLGYSEEQVRELEARGVLRHEDS